MSTVAGVVAATPRRSDRAGGNGSDSPWRATPTLGACALGGGASGAGATADPPLGLDKNRLTTMPRARHTGGMVDRDDGRPWAARGGEGAEGETVAAGPRARARKGAGAPQEGAGAREEGADAAPNPPARSAGSAADCTGGGEDPPFGERGAGWGGARGGPEGMAGNRRGARVRPAPGELSGPQRTIREGHATLPRPLWICLGKIASVNSRA